MVLLQRNFTLMFFQWFSILGEKDFSSPGSFTFSCMNPVCSVSRSPDCTQCSYVFRSKTRMLGGNLSLLAKPASSFRVTMYFTNLSVIIFELDSYEKKKSLWLWNPSPPANICSYFSWRKTEGEGNICFQLQLNLHWKFPTSVVLWSLNARVPFIMVTQVILVSPEHSPSDPGLKETILLKSCFKLEGRPSMFRENAYEEEKRFWPV